MSQYWEMEPFKYTLHCCCNECKVFHFDAIWVVQFFLVCGTKASRELHISVVQILQMISPGTLSLTRTIENTLKIVYFVLSWIETNLTSVDVEFGQWQVINFVAVFVNGEVKSILNCETKHLSDKLLLNQILGLVKIYFLSMASWEHQFDLTQRNRGNSEI